MRVICDKQQEVKEYVGAIGRPVEIRASDRGVQKWKSL